MSHTTKIGDFAFIHNGDYSGDVEIVRASDVGRFTLPIADLIEFVGQIIASRQIEFLEQATGAQILGLAEHADPPPTLGYAASLVPELRLRFRTSQSHPIHAVLDAVEAASRGT